MNIKDIPRCETHAHSHFSNIRLLDSINRPKDLILTAAKLGLKGIALTDHEVLSGHVEWLQLEKKLKEENKIPKDFKCILGNEIYLTNDRSKSQKYFHFILLAKDTEGHRQLRELSSKAWYNSYYDRGMERVPTLKTELKAIIEKNKGHIIATSACFKKGTKVLTLTGEKSIEDINENDFILNKDGVWEKVNFPTSRDYFGNGYQITFLENNTPTICTENHKFLVTTNNKLQYYKKTGKNPFSWIEAKDLNYKKGSSKHICLFPINVTYSNKDVLNIFNKAIDFCSNKYIEINGVYYKKVYIKEIKKLSLNEKVYCLNVNSHSFVCNGVIVHNCLGGELPNLVLALTKAESARNRNEEEINSIKSEIVSFLKFCTDLFGKDFYIEIAPNASSKEQIIFNNRVKDIARALGIKMIFATDAHYLTAKDRPMHKAYLNSKEGEREVDGFYWAAHLMDNQEAFDNLYPYYNEEEFSELCANTMEIFDKVGKYDIFHNPIIPMVEVKDYPKTLSYFGVNNSYKDELDSNWKTIKSLLLSDNPQERYWINQCMEGLINKNLFNDEYISRIETEADIIKTISEKLGNCLFAYFNTFQHYIDLFWECGSLSGPGRGSSVCFLSNYLLGITQLDPIKWGLMEWRFLNKERVELPDIDTDLSPSKRKLIFKKIREERGELNLLQVATFGTEGTRSAILTACRGYRGSQNENGEFEYPEGIDVDIAQYMTSLIPQERGFLWSLNDVVNGNEEKDRKPVKAFIEEINKYEGLLDVMFSIEGLVNKRSQHASGVILYNSSPFETDAIMRSPNGDLTTQFSLHDAEALGDTKFDFLVTEICDKITNALNLLKNDGYFKECNTLREIYEKYLHPEVINLEDNRIWDALAKGSVLDVFQFNSDVGLQAAKQIKPKDPIEMTMANALMRLMGEKDKERPLDRYVRLKNNIQEWYQEVRSRELSENEIKVLERYYLPRKGVPALQEDLMLVCMDKDIAHFTLKEANNARKVVAKKKMDQIPKLKKQFLDNCPNHNFGEYIWETTMGPQMGYSFALPHSLAYSFVGIQTLILATEYPSIYWNCACLITNSGGNEDADDEDEEENKMNCVEENNLDEEDEDDDDEEEVTTKKKKKARNTNYGKISTAIGTMQHAGISVSPPDINKSSFTFIPDVETDTIIYGIKGINRIGNELVNEIISKRPYDSIKDFLSKVKVNKPQMVSLIKSGAFDKFGESREKVMYQYIDMITEKKQRLTLQNMKMLIEHSLIPEEFSFEVKVFNFNKYLKKCKTEDNYYLDKIAYSFYEQHFDLDLLWYDEDICLITQKDWDKIYKKQMDSMREYIKENSQELLNKLNSELFEENWNKYCGGNISKWEMDSISFYYHEHELENLNEKKYNIYNFETLPVEPEIERIINIKGKDIPILKLYRLAGTVLDKNKTKNSITLLTKYGVVNVKIYQAQFAKYDKQISQKLPDGRKKVIEKSWFSRGNKLLITGTRRGDQFILKKYKNSPYKNVIELIKKINEDGTVELQFEREEN